MSPLALLALLLFQGAPVSRTPGVVIGQIRMKDGTPAREVRVSALESADAGAPDPASSMLASFAVTDTDGRFRLQNVPAGRYYITAGFLAFPTYYPGVASITDAKVVTVGPGATVNDVDFQIVRSIGVKVSGRVRGAPEGALHGALSLSLRQPLRPALATATAVVIAAQPDGSFEFQKVLPGSYIVQLPPGPSINITVYEEDIAGLVINAPPMLFGRVSVDEGGKPPPFEQIRIEARQDRLASPRVKPASAGFADGTFVIFDVTGEYRLALTTLPFGFRVKTITMGSIDLTRASATAPATIPGDVPEIHVVLTAAPAPNERTVSGRVVNIAVQAVAPGARGPGGPGGAPVGSIQIQGVSATGEYRIGVTELRADGRFEIKRVPPGQYRIASIPGGSALVVVEDHDIAGVELSASTVPSMDPSCVNGGVGIVRVDDWSPLPPFQDWFQLGINGNPIVVGEPQQCPGLNVAVLRSPLSTGDVIEILKLPLNYYVKSMTFGGADLTRTSTVPGGSPPNARIEVVLTKSRPAGRARGVNVSGRITNVDLPVSATLLLTLSRVSTEDDLYRGAQVEVAAKKGGIFEIEGLPRGTYKLQFSLGPGNAVGICGGRRTVECIAGDAIGNLGKILGLGAEADWAASFRDSAVQFDVGETEITNLELRFELQPKSEKPESVVPTNLNSVITFNGTVVGMDGVIPPFALEFTTQDGKGTRAVSISGGAFTVQLPEGEYRATVSGLPSGYTAASISGGPLDLTEPFLVNSAGIADRFTGKPVVRGQNAASSSPAAITVRLTAK